MFWRFARLRDFHRGAMQDTLEGELCAELELEGIEGIAGSAEAQDWVGAGRAGENGVSIKRIQIFDVGAIEQVKHIAAQFCAKTFLQLKCPSYAEVKAGVAWPLNRVASQVPRTIRERVAVSVGIRAC